MNQKPPEKHPASCGIDEKFLRDRSYEFGDCLIWTQGTNGVGYPQVKVPGGTAQLVRRLAAAVGGKPPAKGQPVTTTCNEKLCVNPAHMKPSTKKAIGKAAAARGAFSGLSRAGKIAGARRAGLVKLTDDQVAAIRASEDSDKELGQAYGVKSYYVARIRRGDARRDYASPWAGLGARA